MRLSTTLTLLSTLTVAACDSDSSSGSGSVEDRLAGAYCGILDTCFGAADTGENVILMLARQLSASDCRTFVKRTLLADTDFDAKVKAGTYTVDNAKLDTCIAELKQSCGLNGATSCSEAIDGTVAIGAACSVSEDCDGDAYCSFDACDRKCVARVALGADCETSSQCSSAAGPATCGYPSAKCIPIVFTSNVAAGAPCGEIEAEDKLTIASCASHLACVTPDEGEAVCTAPIAAGAACQGDHAACVSGNICLPDGEDGGKCGTLNVANSVGASCKEEFGASDAVFCNPTLFLGCIAGKCVKAGDGSVGAVCFADQDLGGQCVKANFCDRESNKCVAKKADGAACESDDECAGDYCDTNGDAGTCNTPDLCSPPS